LTAYSRFDYGLLLTGVASGSGSYLDEQHLHFHAPILRAAGGVVLSATASGFAIKPIAFTAERPIL